MSRTNTARRLRNFAFISLILINPVLAGPACRPPPADYEFGAHIYIQRCALCHGNNGLGEGLLPLLMGDYVDTRLFGDDGVPDRATVRQQIELGGILPEINDMMPPWRKELSAAELDAVTDFVILLANDKVTARKLIRKSSEAIPPSIKVGRATFNGRCALCHGKSGEGDGKLANFITNPPPFNLTLSRLPDAMLQDIITKGGEGVGRSIQMPAWGDELNSFELNSLMQYLKTLRRT